MGFNQFLGGESWFKNLNSRNNDSAIIAIYDTDSVLTFKLYKNSEF